VNELRRELAPISERAWALLEEEASRALRNYLAARRLVDFRGPLGWHSSSVPLGRVEPITLPTPSVQARLRKVQPLMELRVPFALSRAEIEDAGRGADDPDLAPVVDAARAAATAEDQLVFTGNRSAGVTGMIEASPHEPLMIDEQYTRYPGTVARAVAQLRRAGVSGPYAVALGPRCYTGLVETTTPAGFPIVDNIRSVVDGPLVWAPALDGGAVISLRGGDFEIACGRDFAVGYLEHDQDSVTLYLEESITFRVLGPEAVVHLAYADATP
jgi:uncharacterized linocin/CFP29 family protein